MTNNETPEEILLEIPDFPEDTEQVPPVEPDKPSAVKTEPPVFQRREHTLLPTRRKPPIAVDQPIQQAILPMPPKAAVDPPTQTADTMSSNNAQKLRQAILHLTRYFHLADAEQIEGRKFFGKVSLSVTWQNGEAEIIRTGMEQADTGVRNGK